MNFHAVATEIMLTANEEKWQETRDKIERALQSVQFQTLDMYCYKGGGATPPAEWLRGLLPPEPDFWRDQPDGVR